MQNDSGWLGRAEPSPSPNWDHRPEGVDVDLLVIHNISLPPNEFGGRWIDALFHNRLDPDAHPCFRAISDARVSSHLLIRRDGQLIQYVDLHKRAWHAGLSSFEGRGCCNDFSIGIELEGADQIPFTSDQYVMLGRVTSDILVLFPTITVDRITGHSDIAPGRKTDPGPAFDWQTYRRLITRPPLIP